LKIVSLHNDHDAGVALFDDWELVFACKEERLNRVKQSAGFPHLSWEKLTRLVPAHAIDAVVLPHHWRLHYRYFLTQPPLKQLERRISEKFKGKKKDHKGIYVFEEMERTQRSESEVCDIRSYLRTLGFRPNVEIAWSNHHRSHALLPLYYSPAWQEALLMTADARGDNLFYSIYALHNGQLIEHYGGDGYIYNYQHPSRAASLGLMYSRITSLAGFTQNRHEGKITGLAAFGKPTGYDELRAQYFIDEKGIIRSKFNKWIEMAQFMERLHKRDGIENLSATGQKVLEEVMLASAIKLRTLFPAKALGLCGGVFANVKLNETLAERSGVDEIFVYPGMGDEGIPVGSVLDYLLRRYGTREFLHQRRELGAVYYGDEISVAKIKETLPSGFRLQEVSDIPGEAAILLQKGGIGAIFTKGMEWGPRALGARTIMATPAHSEINRTLNHRLTRTEFMPFAPVVRKERLHEVFELSEGMVRAARYMTVTCSVKPQWKEKIPAVVHVDGTARPQWIAREDNPLYYDTIQAFEKVSGLPVLINTSFNAHEEPIINTFGEALKALGDQRVDFLITDAGLVFRSES